MALTKYVYKDHRLFSHVKGWLYVSSKVCDQEENQMAWDHLERHLEWGVREWSNLESSEGGESLN